MMLFPRKIKNILLSIFLLYGGHILAQEGKVKIDRNPDIDVLLILKKEIEANSSQYKIQIFSGSSRSDAEETKKDFDKIHKDIKSSIEYETPNYKIWVGGFKNRLEADRILLKIKKDYPNAFIFKPKQDNKKSD